MKADTSIRVTKKSANWLSDVRDRFALASVAIVVERLIERYGKDLVSRKAAP